MTTFKALVLSHQKRRDGTYNVKIRVTHNRKHKYIKTALYAGKNDLTKSLKIKNHLITDATDEIIKVYRTRCTQIGAALGEYSVEKLCATLEEGAKQEEWKVNFFEYAEKIISKGKAKTTQNNYRGALMWLKKYAGENVLLSDINKKFLQGLLVFIEDNKKTHIRERMEIQSRPMYFLS